MLLNTIHWKLTEEQEKEFCRIQNLRYEEIDKYRKNHPIHFTEITAEEISKIWDEKIIFLGVGFYGNSINIIVDVFDIYTGDNIDSDKKSIAYKLKFEDSNKTLTDEEVNIIFNNIIEYIEKKHNAKVRDN